MNHTPSPTDAAAALRDVNRREDQALESLHSARWVYAVFGIVLFCALASNDFAPPEISQWSSTVIAVMAIGHMLLIRTRRGAALLGHRARFDRRVVPAKFTIIMALVIVALLVTSFVLIALGVRPSVPYLSTGMGAVLATALIGFGPQLQNGLNALVKRSR